MATLTNSYQKLAQVTTSTYSQLRLYGKVNSQNTTNNTSSISLQLRLYGNGGSGSFSSGTAKISGTSYSLGNTSYSKGNETTLCTKTYTATHSNDGTYTTSISYSLTSSATPSGSGSVSITAPKINRLSVLTQPSNFTFGNNITVSYTEYVAAYTANLNLKINGTTFATRTNISSGDTVTLNATELTNAYTLSPNSTTPTVTFELVTKSGGTTLGSTTKTATGTIPSSVVPSITNITLTDTSGIYSTVGDYVQGKSIVSGAINASGGTGSSISSYSTSINGRTITGNPFIVNVDTTGTNSYTVTVTDSRGRTKTSTGSFNVIAYSNPSINTFSVVRCDSNGDEDDGGSYVKINVSSTITALNNTNGKSFKIQYKLHSASTWTDLLTYNSSYTYTLTNSVQSGYSSSNDYDFKLTAIDSYATTSSTIYVPTQKTVLDFYSDGTGVAVGKVAQTANLFEVDLNTTLNKNLTVSGTSQIQNGLYSKPTGQANTPVGNSMLVIKRVTNAEAPNNGVVLEFGNSTSWVGQLYIGDNATQGIYYNGWSNGTRGSWRRLADVPVVLYNNSSGTNGNVTLSSSATNYTYLEIFYRGNDNQYSSVKVFEPNGKEVSLLVSLTASNQIYFKQKIVNISGTSITNTNYSQARFNASSQGWSNDNYIYITRVIGYY